MAEASSKTTTKTAPRRLLVSPGRVWAIGANTFREAVRHRVFLALGIAGVALLLFSLLLSELAVSGQLRRVLLDFGFFAISLFCLIAAVSLGAVLLHKELDKKTIYTLLSKPVARHEFLLGKYLGMVGVVELGLVALSVIWFLVLAAQGVSVDGEVIKALALIAMEAALATAVAVMFSAMSSAVMTGLLSFGVIFAGRLVPLMNEALLATGKDAFFVKNAEMRGFFDVFTTVWPDFGVFNASQQVLLEVPIPVDYLLQSFLYASAYGAVFLVLGMFAIHRRDFT